jgi:hypothetical protein
MKEPQHRLSDYWRAPGAAASIRTSAVEYTARAVATERASRDSPATATAAWPRGIAVTTGPIDHILPGGRGGVNDQRIPMPVLPAAS